MEIEKSVGRKIKQYRLAKRMTIAQLSKLTGISAPQISRIENGKTSTPVSSLNTIAKAIGTQIGFLFSDDEADNPRIAFTRRNRGIISRKGMQTYGYNYEALTATRKKKAMEPFLVRVDKAKADESVVFNHPGEEFIFLLKGEVIFTYEEEQFHLKKGDCVYFDSKANHILKNIGNTEVELLMIMGSQ
jgi:transcriptional regulator with XRE-family HTH domain